MATKKSISPWRVLGWVVLGSIGVGIIRGTSAVSAAMSSSKVCERYGGQQLCAYNRVRDGMFTYSVDGVPCCRDGGSSWFGSLSNALEAGRRDIDSRGKQDGN